MSDELFLLSRHALPSDSKSLRTIYNHDESKGTNEIESLVMAESNVQYIADMIIARADPLRNGSTKNMRAFVVDRVLQLLTSWKNLGKFDSSTITFEGKTLRVQAVSSIALLDHYNKDFVDAFADTIISTNNPTKVTSVVDPNGLYAQQERIIKINSKPVPFYERALYRRLADKTLDQRIDETEAPFYKMDHNPRLTDIERKKTNTSTSKQMSYMDREGLAYRMNPRYNTM